MFATVEPAVMDPVARVNRALDALLKKVLCADDKVPARLAKAMRHAVFSGGGRLRPSLCIAVASSCGEDMPEVTDGTAAAIELLHCASLVHDDLPCFDNAAMRRGQPSVHSAFGEACAVLSGDALIVLAFQALALGANTAPERLSELVLILCRATGMPSGIVAGQARECESNTSWISYHTEKTGALFAAATMAGAAAAGASPAPWRELGYLLGRAYQIADDIRDVNGFAAKLGKPTGQDSARGRPNAVQALGLGDAIKMLDALVTEAIETIPDCTGLALMRRFIMCKMGHAYVDGYCRSST